MSITAFQQMTAAAWFVTALFLIPGTFRAFFRKPRYGDHAKSGFFFIALVMVGGCTRFLVAPNDITTWKFIYSLSTLSAVYVLIIVWNIRRDRHG